MSFLTPSSSVPRSVPSRTNAAAKPFSSSARVVERLLARGLIAGAACDVSEFAQADDRHRGRESEVLLVLLPLLPDRRVGGDDQSVASIFPYWP